MRTRLAAALSAAALVAALAGLAHSAAAVRTSAARTPTLTVAIPGSFAGCDPGSPTTSAATDAVLSLVLPSAFVPGPLDSPDGDTYVIAQAEPVAVSPQTVQYTIAQGAAWPGGAPITAADLVRTWRERRADGVLADLGYRDVASVTPTAKGTGVLVRFRTPYADWESLFNLIVPATTFAARCTAPSATLDPSVGPYELVTASRTSVTLRANRSWPGTPPAYPNVVVTTDPSSPPPSSTSGGARIAYLPSPTLAQLEAITSSGGYASRVQHDTTIVSLDFAVHGSAALLPWARGAVARLVDRAALVADVVAPVDDTAAPEDSHLFGQGQVQYLGATGTPVSSPTSPTQATPGASGSAAYGDGPDPGAAAAALRAHGYSRGSSGWRAPSGGPVGVCLAAPQSQATLRATASLIAAQLRSRGIAVEVEREPTVGAVIRTLRTGTCTAGIVSRTGDGFVSHAAASWLRPTSPIASGLQWTGVDDPVVATDAASASRVLDPDTAATTWDAMDARLWDLMASLPLYSPSVFVGWSPSMQGILPTDTVGGFVAQVPTLLPTPTKS